MAIRMYILHVAQMFLISYRCHQMHISYIIQIGGLDENVQKRTLEMAAIVFLLNTDLKTSNASSKYNPVKVLL